MSSKVRHVSAYPAARARGCRACACTRLRLDRAGLPAAARTRRQRPGPARPRPCRQAAAAARQSRRFPPRTARATPTAARARRGRAQGRAALRRRTATIAPAGRTDSPSVARNEHARRFRRCARIRDEGHRRPIGSRCAASPPRADVGRPRRAASSSCCTAGWTSRRRSSSWSTRSRDDWHAIAPDWRGFGRSEWQPHGYWFADYVADLEALVARARARRAASTSSATAWAATSR